MKDELTDLDALEKEYDLRLDEITEMNKKFDKKIKKWKNEAKKNER